MRSASSDTSSDRAHAPGPATGGGMDAFEFAVKNNSRTLWSVAAAVLGRRDDAEDVVQEAVIVALGKRQEFAKVENFTAWLAQIVRFVALNRRRSAKLRAAEGEDALRHVPAPVTANAGSADPAHLVDTRGNLLAGEKAFDDHVMRALDTLDDTPRACLLLRILNDLSYKEIGTVLEIPEGTAMSHVFRARRVLLEMLGSTVQASRLSGREKQA